MSLNRISAEPEERPFLIGQQVMVPSLNILCGVTGVGSISVSSSLLSIGFLVLVLGSFRVDPLLVCQVLLPFVFDPFSDLFV